MNKIFLLLLLTISSSYAQDIEVSHKEIKEIKMKVMSKLGQDRVAIEHFFLVGKLRCYKELKLGNKSKIDYDARWLRGGMLNYPLLSVIKHEKIIQFFDDDIKVKIKEKKRNLALRAEKFYGSPTNGIFICESLNRINKKNTQKYQIFIQDLSNYHDYENYGYWYDGYLKDEIVTNDYW